MDPWSGSSAASEGKDLVRKWFDALSPEQSEKIVDALLAMRRIPPLLTALETKLGFVKYAEPADDSPATNEPADRDAPAARPSASEPSADGQ